MEIFNRDTLKDILHGSEEGYVASRGDPESWKQCVSMGKQSAACREEERKE